MIPPAPTPSTSSPGWRREAPLLAVILLDSVSYALILPLLPAIMEVHGAGALAGGLLVGAHALMAAGSAPILGMLSDRHGRRAVILVSVLGTVVSYVVFALAPGLVTLFVSRLLAGAMAGNIGVVQAAIADGRTPDQRTAGMAAVNAAWALGFVAGPALAALLTLTPGAPGFWPGLAAAGAGLVSFGLMLAWRPRPRIGEPPAPAPTSSPAPAMGRTLLMALFGTLAIAQTGLVALTGFWAQAAFGWGGREVALLFLWTAAAIVAAQLTIVPRLSTWFGEAGALTAGLGLSVMACALVPLVHSAPGLLLISGPLLFCGIVSAQTVCTAMISRATSDGAQGAALGLANGVAAACRVVAPAATGLLFERIHPDAPFLAVGAMLLTWLLIVAVLIRTARPVRA